MGEDSTNHGMFYWDVYAYYGLKTLSLQITFQSRMPFVTPWEIAPETKVASL